MKQKNRLLGSVLLLLVIAGLALGLAAWKRAAFAASQAAGALHPEPMEVVTAVHPVERDYVRKTTAIGTVMALRSITLRNEIAGRVSEVHLTPGAIVEPGTLLVALDVAVESAELRAQEAQVALAETMLGRMERARENRGASEADVDRARSERDVLLANVARTRAVIDRKTIRAPFRARVGLSDVHEGQYLNEGVVLTTLQGVDDAVHVDFTATQQVALFLKEGDKVEVSAAGAPASLQATVVALDSRVDPATRNVSVRARIDGAARAPLPGAAVRVRVPIGISQRVVTIPADALRRGPAGDHVFVLQPDDQGKLRAHMKPVRSGALLGDAVVIEDGVALGDQVAASGSFKLREGVLVAVTGAGEAASH
ncbi:MAG: efflux RND transporter periplasmic adaptor subunit [Planctomycetes bacterium]|nr:efflux RND transporter periplasmic adaptor subunit [Planctomycetota bacterium]